MWIAWWHFGRCRHWTTFHSHVLTQPLSFAFPCSGIMQWNILFRIDASFKIRPCDLGCCVLEKFWTASQFCREVTATATKTVCKQKSCPETTLVKTKPSMTQENRKIPSNLPPDVLWLVLQFSHQCKPDILSMPNIPALHDAKLQMSSLQKYQPKTETLI